MCLCSMRLQSFDTATFALQKLSIIQHIRDQQAHSLLIGYDSIAHSRSYPA
jgi:hypothetical protein